MIFVDSHFHLDSETFSLCKNDCENHAGVISVCSKNELKKVHEIKQAFPLEKIAVSFGAYNAYDFLENAEYVLDYGKKDLELIEKFLKTDEIDAVGEAILDASTQGNRRTLKAQIEIFSEEVNLAKKYQKNLIIHCVRCMMQLFEFSSLLKDIPAVVFHGFSGTVHEAEYFLKHGVNCFFSFGASLVNGKKSATSSVSSLPIERILFETDFPFCNIRGSKLSRLETLYHIYCAAAKVRSLSLEQLTKQIYFNFSNAFFNSATNSL